MFPSSLKTELGVFFSFQLLLVEKLSPHCSASCRESCASYWLRGSHLLPVTQKCVEISHSLMTTILHTPI